MNIEKLYNIFTFTTVQTYVHKQGNTQCQDSNNGAVDSGGDGCGYYESYPDACSTGTYDDDDFTASTMCCGCGNCRISIKSKLN